MSNDKFSIDDESVNRIAEAVNKINKNKSDSNQTPLEPYIQDLIPWIRNVDKRKITICNGCGVTFIGNKIGQKSCSSICRNLAWRRETGYHPLRDYTRKGKAEKKDDRSAYQHYREPYAKAVTVPKPTREYIDFIDSEHPNDKGRD